MANARLGSQDQMTSGCQSRLVCIHTRQLIKTTVINSTSYLSAHSTKKGTQMDQQPENDIINQCPQCGKPNQFGELCPVCADRKRIANNQRVTQGTEPKGSLDKRGWQ
jgi:methionyl-tRNA synthetase